MAYFRGLRVAFAVLALCAGAANAQTCPAQPSGGWSGTFGDSYTTFSAIRAAYIAAGESSMDLRAEQWQINSNGNYAWFIYWNSTGTTNYNGQIYRIWPVPQSTSSTFVYASCTETAPMPTPAQCLARNAGGVVDRMYIAGTAPTSYCNANCTITVSASPLSTSAGINPVTGASASWGRHEQIYSGAVCQTSSVVNQDGNPENSMSVPSPGTTALAGSCDFTAGTCTDGKGQVSYCTFTGTGAAATPSSCVPAAGDSDGDGVPNDNDSAPNDPNNGKDTTGTETDNVSTGGGSCASPPISSGDGITAQIAFQTWSTRCAVKDAADEAHWDAIATQLAISGIQGASGLDATDSQNLNDVKSATESAAYDLEAIGDQMTPSHGFGDVATAASASDGSVTTEDAFDTPGGDPYAPDEDGWLTVARECPNLPTIVGLPGGESIDLNVQFENFCSFMEIGGKLIYLFGMLAAIKIYSKVFTA